MQTEGISDPFEEWHALFVLTGDEDNVKERLNFRFKNKYRLVVPKRRLRERRFGVWNEVLRPLFPGYVLIQGSIPHEEYSKFYHVPGLLKVMKSGYDMVEICSDEIEFIARLIDGGDIIGYSDVFVEGEYVKIISGPLMNMEGYIKSIDVRKRRAKVCINFLNEESVVDLGIRLISHIGGDYK